MIGLGTYSYFWRLSSRMREPLGLLRAIEDTAGLGVGLFQICDWEPLDSIGDGGAREIASVAASLGVRLQLGTRGTDGERLARYLRLAELMGVRLVRSMTADVSPAIDRALSASLVDWESAGVALALETYEQVETAGLVALVARLDSPSLGICLDPANVVARLEHPRRCVELAAGHVVAVHAKDFAFTRQPGWVGFSLSGAPLGDGLHDYDHLLASVSPRERGVDEVVEHWLPWQDDAETTARTEREWTDRALARLRRNG